MQKRAEKRFYMRRGQSSFEYIMLVALVLLFVVSGVGIIYSYSQKSNEDIKVATIEKIGVEIVDSVEKVYYIGGDSWETIKVSVPDGVKNIKVVAGNELVITYDTYGGISDAVFYSDINITTPYSGGVSFIPIRNLSSSFHTGLNMIKVTSNGSTVIIEEVT